MSKLNWKDLENKTHKELMAIVGKIEAGAKDVVEAGEAFYTKHEKEIKKAICGHQSSISGKITKENIDQLVETLASHLNKTVDTKDKVWEALAALAVDALKQGLNNYCANYNA
ncbi:MULTISPECIES: hypothetical protein [unclassified Aureispira]|uniref:hypothetical protein n=1 Tax=unclassified Aureispira TaxID=2649989 RepID=UPI0006990DAD|nr:MULTISPECIES: hypothetical protein [unclassified Aureispira]WMX12011.1 hypothetical protein QP953_14385 [Aureispira sp. CCB-E]